MLSGPITQEAGITDTGAAEKLEEKEDEVGVVGEPQERRQLQRKK